MASVRDCLQRSGELETISDSPRLDCEVLLSHAVKQNRTWLYTWPESPLTKAQQVVFDRYFSRRLQGEPVAYIVGYREFWSLPLAVNESTLIPRPETELLVELALASVPTDEPCRILDLGTGTGAIALAIASERPTWHITGVDQSPEAISLARDNGKQLQLTQVRWLHSHWFSAVAGEQFHMILANPPYISEDDPHLHQGDVRFEPSTALIADNQGMSDIESIVRQAPEYLLPGGFLLLEHGYQQAEAVKTCLLRAGFQGVNTQHDYSGHPRVSLGHR